MSRLQPHNTVILDVSKITKAVRIHLNEPDCKHSIKEIVAEALKN